MNPYWEHHAKQFALEQLMRTSAGEKFQQALQLIQTIQEHFVAFSEKEESASVAGAKAATVLTLAVLKKIASGKKPSSFDAEDWKDLAHAVSQYAVLLEGAQYSVFVFQLYEKYIRASAASMQGAASDKIVEAIAKLADELHEKESLFQNGDLSEAAYIEDCLWISLEAMIKLIASTASLFCGHQTAEFADALASCAFEYGRLMLYRKEQMLIDGFIQSQYCLDAELEKQYAAYLSELETQSKQFYALIDHAFAPDFRTAFLHSILLANAAGVKEAEILSSVEDIDSFFLN